MKKILLLLSLVFVLGACREISLHGTQWKCTPATGMTINLWFLKDEVAIEFVKSDGSQHSKEHTAYMYDPQIKAGLIGPDENRVKFTIRDNTLSFSGREFIRVE